MYVFSKDALEKMLKKRRMSKNKLAQQLSVTHTAVNSWGMDGRKPTCSNIELMTKVLQCSPNSLFLKLEVSSDKLKQ